MVSSLISPAPRMSTRLSFTSPSSRTASSTAMRPTDIEYRPMHVSWRTFLPRWSARWNHTLTNLSVVPALQAAS